MDLDLATQVALSLARRFEGCRLSSYLDSVACPTIGYGTTWYPDGRKVKITDPPITLDQALGFLRTNIRTSFLPAVLKLCPEIDCPDRLAAVIDFAYNCGIGNLRASTLRRKINAGQWEVVPTEFRKWNRAGGKVLRGLVLRREAEIALL